MRSAIRRKSLTVTSLHQLGVAVLWRLFVDGCASTLIFVCLDPIAAAAGAVGVAGDVRWSRVVFCVWGEHRLVPPHSGNCSL